MKKKLKNKIYKIFRKRKWKNKKIFKLTILENKE